MVSQLGSLQYILVPEKPRREEKNKRKEGKDKKQIRKSYLLSCVEWDIKQSQERENQDQTKKLEERPRSHARKWR
ncbi:expressed protein [Echinococcus multilocularis]|uniref:Expressed protein n=1 Tax=Echinococcus multilocularis TaxID=6211 RepID=A0A068XVH5_ECHMU|nr:expressed protein [Echinococcus multilocularis]